MKEMVGGCCVCSDERGWPENPLVYCDGQNCTVAVHQACYGIVTVPTGPWYCRKCESQERSARVRCELCPSRDGALKKTDNHGWAHVVCALYIPEVRFGNVTTMEPIILQLIPQERYSKTCYICQEIGKGSKAHVGACMQCNKSGCKQQFHVTCAQGLGLLCEEAGNYLDNVKYCGYCQHHYSKLKKGGNVKTIPPYKPVTNEAGSSDPPSSPEKESEQLPSNHHNTASTSASLKSVSQTPMLLNQQTSMGSSTATSATSASSSKQRKSGGGNTKQQMNAATIIQTPVSVAINALNPSIIAAGNLKITSNNAVKDAKHKNVGKGVSSSNKGHDNNSARTDKQNKSKLSNKDSLMDTGSNNSNSSIASSSNLSTSNINSLPSSAAGGKETLGQKFTTSNFTETIVVNSESVFGGDVVKGPSSGSSSGNGSNSTISGNSAIASSSTTTVTAIAKKRKADGGKMSSANSSTEDINKDLIKDVSVTLVPLPMDRTDHQLDDKNSKKQKTETTSPPLHIVNEPNLQNVSPNLPMQQQNNSSNISSINKIITQQNQSATGSTIQQSPLVKLSTNIDSRIQQQQSTSSSPYNISSSSSSSTLSTTSSVAAGPSLVVSVPLSTANVPGVNLPPSTTAPIIHLNQTNNNYHVGSTSQQQRHEQVANISAHRLSPIVNAQQQQQQQISQHLHSITPNMLERQSPSVVINNPIHSPHHHIQQQQPINVNVGQNSPNLQSNVSVLRIASPISNKATPSSIAIVQPMETEGSLKITYEKQPNNRITQLQDEAPAGRRSRSQSSETSNNKTRSKKRAATSGGAASPPSAPAPTLTPPTPPTPPSSSSSGMHIITPDNTVAATSQASGSSSSSYNPSNSFGGLKFSYEAQTGSSAAATANVTPSVTPQPPSFKDSPPSSPGSENGSSRNSKRNRTSSETKDFKIFQNGVHATHMLGNQLNPSSSVAQKMSDQLHMELEAHSVYTSSSLDSGTQLIGPQFPGKQQAQMRSNAAQAQLQAPPSLTSMLGGNGQPTASGNTPQSLEQLLERQWEQGSQFLMEQAQHFDIASLLSCLHQLKGENVRLEEHVTNLVARRDHLLAVNARLAIPLNPSSVAQPPVSFNNMHLNGPNSTDPTRMPRNSAAHNFNQQQQIPLENGIDFRHSSSTTHQGSSNTSAASRQQQPPPQPQLSSQPTNISFTNQSHSLLSRQQSSAISTNNNNNNPDASRSVGGRLSSSSSSSISGGPFSQHSSTTAYSTSTTHQQNMQQNRRDDSQVKPS